jgi:hypothetical protein
MSEARWNLDEVAEELKAKAEAAHAQYNRLLGKGDDKAFWKALEESAISNLAYCHIMLYKKGDYDESTLIRKLVEISLPKKEDKK